MIEAVIDRILGMLARLTERVSVWHKWPFLLALGAIVGHRVNLREGNLHDTEADLPDFDTPPDPGLPPDFDLKEWRTPDGSFNDLDQTWIGRAGQRFGRNVPLSEGFVEKAERLMKPSPRLVSNKLLARNEFVPVPYLNILAAAWSLQLLV